MQIVCIYCYYLQQIVLWSIYVEEISHVVCKIPNVVLQNIRSSPTEMFYGNVFWKHWTIYRKTLNCLAWVFSYKFAVYFGTLFIGTPLGGSLLSKRWFQLANKIAKWNIIKNVNGNFSQKINVFRIELVFCCSNYISDLPFYTLNVYTKCSYT